MRKSRYKSPKKVLVFNSSGRMVSTICSLHAAAQMIGLSPMAISLCCTGKSIASGGYYFRYENPDVLLDNDDCGKLKIEEFDQLCGATRTYKTKVEMNKLKLGSVNRRTKQGKPPDSNNRDRDNNNNKKMKT